MISIIPVAAALAVAGPPEAVPAPPEEGVVRLENLSAVDLFALADRAREAGRADEALALYDALAQDGDPEIRAEARFRKGMALADAQRYREAALALRALLDEQPRAARVRLELARLLTLIGDEAAARRELRQAQAAGLPPEVAATVGQFDQVLRSMKIFGGHVEIALAPDSNVNRATQARTLDTIIAPLTLSDDARARSGVGAHVSGQTYARLALGEKLKLIPRASGVANLYGESHFNDVSASALLGLEWQGARDRLTPSIGRTWRWYGGSLHARTDALSLSWIHALGRQAQLIVGGSTSRATYERNDFQNGYIFDIHASYERAMSARTGIGITLSATRQTAQDPGYATAGGGVTLLAWREAGRTTLFGSVGLRRTEGDAALFLFGVRRQEWLATARAGATFRNLQVKGFAPFARIGFERNTSSVGIYDYRRVATEVGLTRAF
ncbi:surface lipoprotein assembly modifier [Sphingomonas sp. LY54]|uniref:surface lipoprotein assembly modifier n=1 Tax=Sphingomonas sp. LY54 TaxID=3095343 RepID=UPI002D768CFF|nr:surface lipoprotein assembly modifier [Sphingomonas sp. LY54]WRP27881.1 surface lipoprotein assembly modifier [Sphingomonas sp. LY54]